MLLSCQSTYLRVTSEDARKIWYYLELQHSTTPSAGSNLVVLIQHTRDSVHEVNVVARSTDQISSYDFAESQNVGRRLKEFVRPSPASVLAGCV